MPVVDNTRARQNTNRDYAIALAKIGVAVFPSSGKTPLIPLYNKLDTEISPTDRDAAIEKYREDHDDKSPIHVGCTKDPETVKRMWRAHRDAVPSVACGPTGIVVLDADAKDAGPQKMGTMWEENGGLPKGALDSPTKSGGIHYIFADPDRTFTNKAGLLKKDYGTDVRGSGGQIVAPGSMLDDGRSYGTKDDLGRFMRAITYKTLPPVPEFVTEMIGSMGEAAHEDIAPSKEREVVKLLQDADWDHHENDFDPVVGNYDLDQLKQNNAEFAKLYDEPSSDCSTNRFLAARHIMREWPDMPAPALSIFFTQWEGSGTYTEDKPKAGEYDDRQIAREWLKNQGLTKPSNGDALGAVVDNDEDEEERAAEEYSKLIESQRLEAAGLKSGPLRFMRDIAVYTPRNDTVEGLCAPGQIGMIHGASNVGKTFSVIHLGECVCIGGQWFGRNVVQDASALYCFGEGAEGLGNRGAAYRTKYPSDLPGMVVHDGIPNLGLNLNKALKALEKAIINSNAMVGPHGRRVRLVFLDTWAKAIAGVQENDFAAVQPILNALRALARKMGVCIILIHHSGKDTMLGARGSSALFADVDFNLEIITDAEAKKRKISGVKPGQLAIISPKMREGNKTGVALFKLEEVQLGTNQWGNPATSMVVVPIIQAPSDGAAMGAVPDDEEPGDTKDILTPLQSRNAYSKRRAFCEAILAAMKPLAKQDGKALRATLDEVAEVLPALQKIREESDTNFSRDLRVEMFADPKASKVLLPGGWLEYHPAAGRRAAAFSLTPRTP